MLDSLAIWHNLCHLPNLLSRSPVFLFLCLYCQLLLSFLIFIPHFLLFIYADPPCFLMGQTFGLLLVRFLLFWFVGLWVLIIEICFVDVVARGLVFRVSYEFRLFEEEFIRWALVLVRDISCTFGLGSSDYF